MAPVKVWRAASTTAGVISLGRHRKESMGRDGLLSMIKIAASVKNFNETCGLKWLLPA
jgi:hypothetical protein